jgi:hypothetical protein
MFDRSKEGRRGRRIATACLAVVSLAAVGLVTAQSSQAGPPPPPTLLPTTTTVTATPSTAGLYRNVTLTATVKILGVLPGLGIVPTGTVTFTTPAQDQAYNDGTAGYIGSAALGSCFLTTCTATIYTTEFAVGADTYTATYVPTPGPIRGFLIGGSAGNGSVTIDLTSYTNNSTVGCPTNESYCDAGNITDGDTWVDTYAYNQPETSHTLTEAVAPGTLGCDAYSPSQEGGLATFTDSSQTDTQDWVDYTLTDPTKAALTFTAAGLHPNSWGCFADSVDFTSGLGGLAPFNAADGYYEAPLPSCGSVSGQTPCFLGPDMTDQYGNPSSTDATIEIEFLNNPGVCGDCGGGGGDPKASGP